MKLLQIASILMLDRAVGFTVASKDAQVDAVAPRHLQETVDTCYYECLRQAMTADQCAEYIQSVLGGESLPDSPYPNTSIKISRPRSPDAKAATYWEVGIPVNIHGEVSCNINGGMISYRDPWVIDDTTSYSIPDTNCAGLNAATCCDQIKANVVNAGIPLVDQNGNCLSCWVHQETLIPAAPPAGGGEVSFLVHDYVPNTMACLESEMTTSEVQATDDAAEVELVNVVNAIDMVLEKDAASCDELKNLQHELYVKARSFVRAMVPISSFLCGHCVDGVDSYSALPASIVDHLTTIRNTIHEAEINSDEIVIVIYVDHGDLVMEPPKIGGSRAELDFDREDPDCGGEPAPGAGPDGADGEPWMAEDEIVGADGNGDPYNPPEDLEEPDEIYYHYDIDEVDPADDEKKFCRPVDLMNASAEKGAPCFKCRKCLLKKCDWDEAFYCRKLLKFKITEDVTVENWISCLETNGGSIEKIYDTDGTFTNWCSCARKCEEDCVPDDVEALPSPDATFGECTAEDMATESADGQTCSDCKMCLQESCVDWNHRVCTKMLSGKKRGTAAKWFACLRSNGATSDLPDTLIFGRGKRDTWSTCARACDDRCYKVKTVPVLVSPETGDNICSASDLATSSARKEECFSCRRCLVNKCRYWKDRCKEILLGVKGDTGTEAEWLQCFSECGQTLPSKEDGARFLETDSWCDCTMKCGRRCEKKTTAAPAM